MYEGMLVPPTDGMYVELGMPLTTGAEPQGPPMPTHGSQASPRWNQPFHIRQPLDVLSITASTVKISSLFITRFSTISAKKNHTETQAKQLYNVVYDVQMQPKIFFNMVG